MKERWKTVLVCVIRVSVRKSVRYVGHKSVNLRFESRCDCLAELYGMKIGYSVKENNCKLRDGITAKIICQIARVLHCSYFYELIFCLFENRSASTTAIDDFQYRVTGRFNKLAWSVLLS